MTEKFIKDVKYVYDSDEDSVIFIKNVTIDGVFVKADGCILRGNGTSTFDVVTIIGRNNESLGLPDSNLDFILIDGLSVITKTEAETFFDKAMSKLKKKLNIC